MNIAVSLTLCEVTSASMPSYTSAELSQSYGNGASSVSLAIPVVTTTPAGCGSIISIGSFSEFSEILGTSTTSGIVIDTTHVYGTEKERVRTVTATV